MKDLSDLSGGRKDVTRAVNPEPKTQTCVSSEPCGIAVITCLWTVEQVLIPQGCMAKGWMLDDSQVKVFVTLNSSLTNIF